MKNEARAEEEELAEVEAARVENLRQFKQEKMFMAKVEEQRQVEVRNVVGNAMVPYKPLDLEEFKV